MDEEIRRLALVHAIRNALKYGKARPGPVIGKVLADRPDLKQRIAEVREIVQQVVEEVNSKSEGEIRRIAEELGVLRGEKREREARKWPPLPNAEKYERIVTRVAPEPNGYPTLGHVKGLMVPFVYARQYEGEFHLRFEDTNPRVERLEFYDAIREEFLSITEAAERVLGLSPGRWDREIVESDHLPEMYGYAEQLIRQGDAYVCTCPASQVRLDRAQGRECPHRSQSVEENLELWRGMLEGRFGEGEAHLRLKTDMRHPNLTMRDPGIFRIIEHPHPIHGDRYRVYPNYDFAVSVMDSLTGVTHAFRSKEFEPHVDVQRTILEKLGLRQYEMIQFGRITVEGLPLSKRHIRPLISAGILWGWDDPRIPTLKGLKRRGITPEALVLLMYDMGPSKVDATVTMDAIAAYNRKWLDPRVPRYMFVADPVKAEIDGVPGDLVAEVRVHPDRPEMGTRRIGVPGRDGVARVYVSWSDHRSLEPGQEIRLRGLANVRVRSVMPDGLALTYLPEVRTDVKIIHWAPIEGAVPAVAISPTSAYSFESIGGFGEPAMSELREGDLVQLIRFGFARVDGRDGETVRLIRSHG